MGEPNHSSTITQYRMVYADPIAWHKIVDMVCEVRDPGNERPARLTLALLEMRRNRRCSHQRTKSNAADVHTRRTRVAVAVRSIDAPAWVFRLSDRARHDCGRGAGGGNQREIDAAYELRRKEARKE